MTTSWSESGNGSARRIAALIRLKMAVLAPIPSASVRTATAVKPRFFRSWRKAYLRSFIAQRLYRIDFRCATGGNQAGQQRNTEQQNAHADQQQRIVWGETETLTGEQPIGCERHGKSGEQTNEHQTPGLQ